MLNCINTIIVTLTECLVLDEHDPTDGVNQSVSGESFTLSKKKNIYLIFFFCSPMLGNPAWKMKEDEFDEEDAVDAMFTIRSPDHMFDDYLASSGLNDM